MTSQTSRRSAFLLVFLAALYAWAGEVVARDHAPDLHRSAGCSGLELTQTLNDLLATLQQLVPDNRGWQLSVRVESMRYAKSLAIGPVAQNGVFRIASVTKTFTAATILRLAEKRGLSLDENLSSALPAPYPDILSDGGYEPDRMTIRQLLHHNSGLFDFAFGNEDYLAAVLADPMHRWSREEQVRFAMEHGAKVGEPGEVHEYSDTGYVLLGAIIEERTRGSLGDAFAKWLRFPRLGLRNTWQESIQRPPQHEPPRAPQTFLGIELASIDPSIDLWGGGGLLSNTGDLARFYEGLLGGRVFRHPETLTVMQSIPSSNAEAAAAMGLYHAGIDCWYHNGAWGAFAGACPEQGITIALTGLDSPAALAGADALFVASLEAAAACAAGQTGP